MITITINGHSKTFPAALDIAALLAQEGYAGMTVAVARNGTFVPKAKQSQTAVQNGDTIDIVAPMQGG
ncbi:MAG: sulfur carrier protein ThiS [Alphaproteobacteria bacterium]|nr:sulfur carrier protein ThiS [Alphaproteobacteria bacterium]